MMMTEKMNGHDHTMMPLAMEDVKKAYMERVYAMNHAELFHELMRVHTESARLLQIAESQLRRLQERIEQYEPIH